MKINLKNEWIIKIIIIKKSIIKGSGKLSKNKIFFFSIGLVTPSDDTLSFVWLEFKRIKVTETEKIRVTGTRGKKSMKHLLFLIHAPTIVQLDELS